MREIKSKRLKSAVAESTLGRRIPERTTRRRWWAQAVVRLGNVHRRMLGVLFVLIGPKYAYRLTGAAAGLLYRLLDPLRVRSEAQCRAALAGRVPDEAVARIAEQSFVNRARNLTDLMLASRLLRADTYARYGGRIPEPLFSQLAEAQLHRKPVILLTAYYGSFDLFPILLGYNGIRATAIYLPHGNPGFDAYRRRIRSQSGCEMVPVDRGGARIGEVLDHGGMVALVADHHVEARGMPVTFLGIETKALRSVGLLAWRYQADVVVAGIRRLGETFQFDLIATDTIRREETVARDDPVAFVTDRYLRALERLIRQDPTQYLWSYARWGEAYAREVVAGQIARPGGTRDSTLSSMGSGSASACRVGDGKTEVQG